MEALLVQIAADMHHMNRRDKIRMVGSTIKGSITVISALFFLWSIVYFAMHGTEIIKQISEQTVKTMIGGSAKTSASSSAGGFMDQFQKYLPEGVKVK